MKRLLLAGILAIGFHALLLSIDLSWIKWPTVSHRVPEKITVTLNYREPEITPVPPVPAPKVRPKKPAPPPNPKKKLPPDPGPTPKPEPVKVEPEPESLPEKQPETETPGVANPPDILPSPVPAPALDEPPSVSQAPPSAPSMPTPVPKLTEAFPLYRSNPPPHYPRIARKRGFEGTVALEVLVGKTGKAQKARVYTSSGYKLLDNAALKSVLNWSFEPGRRGDEPVEMWVRIPIRFELK